MSEMKVEKHPGPFTGPDAELARACAMAVIPLYGDDDEASLQRIKKNGVWNDHVAVQAALAAIHYFRMRTEVDAKEAGDAEIERLTAMLEDERAPALFNEAQLNRANAEIVELDAKIAELEKALKRSIDTGAFAAVAHLQNRSTIAALQSQVAELRGALKQIDTFDMNANASMVNQIFCLKNIARAAYEASANGGEGKTRGEYSEFPEAR